MATRSRLRWFIGATLVAVALLAGGCDNGSESGAPASTTGTTERPASTTTTTAPTAAADEDDAVWPFPGQPAFATPAEAARTFAVDYLGFVDPVLGEFERRGEGAGVVVLRPTARGPMSTITLRESSASSGGWLVTGATTENIELTEPRVLGVLTSPVRLTGSALAFEGTVAVEVRADGSKGPIGSGFVTGGGDEQRPFAGDVAFETPGAAKGALVLFTESAEDGRRWQAVVIRVAFQSTDADALACGTYRSPRPRPAPDQMEVKAYFSCEERVFPVYRLVARSPRPLEAALRALFVGPTDTEREAGVSSWFGTETADMFRSAVINDGHAVVDLRDLRRVIPNASASAGSARLLAELDATVFQFTTVRSVEYRIDGSCEDFTEWLQIGGCEPRTRPPSTD